MYSPGAVSDALDWKLKPLQVPDLPGEIDLGSKSTWTLGRDRDNDLICSAPSVSSQHARLEVHRDSDEIWIEDLGSRNGTYVGGEAIARARLRRGDVFQLGRAGPRFAVVRASGLHETVFVPQNAGAVPSTVETDDDRRAQRVGPETMAVMRSSLGLDASERVDDIVAAERARATWRLAGLGLLLLLVVGGGLYYTSYVLEQNLSDSEARQNDRVAEIARELRDATGVVTRLDREFQQSNTLAESIAKRRQVLEEQVQAVEQEMRGGQITATELASLRAELAETRRRLESLDPIVLERARLERVSTIERAVVLLEVELGLRNADGDVLHFFMDGGKRRANFEGKGERYSRESSGSGFVVDERGFILTNAHVIHKKGELAAKAGGLETVVDVNVVFSNTKERIPAETVAWNIDNGNDLALIRIEPFDGMPNVGGLDLEVPVPDRGSDVFVQGFPLGTNALQPEDDTVVASTFRGIMSRAVGDFLQVDAAVHPGNSGGPVIDPAGRVIGVVVGQQRVGESGASDIGYVIPIARARTVWPPPE